MLLPRIPGLALRRKATKRVYTSCLALQSAAFATGPTPPQPPQPPSETSSSETPTAASVSAPPYQPRRPKRGRTPRPPQPGPPNPPWPDPNPEAGPQRRKAYTYEKGLIENAITLAQLAYPHKFPFPSSPSAKETTPAAAPIFSIAVPRPPDFRNDYTNMGPDVVAPWRKGGAFKPVADREIKAAGASGASGYGQRYTKNYGVRVRYSTLHTLHPWSANHMAASPGIEDVHGASDGQGTGAASSGWPVGFPHSFTEMVRRKYAIKSHTDPLWWFATVFVTADGELPNSNLVRNKMRYKLQSALQAALEQRGYATTGHRLEGKAGAAAKYSQLYGSMRVDGPLGQMLAAPYGDLVGFLAKAVIVVEGLLGDRGQRRPAQVRGGSGAANPKAKPRQNDVPGKKGKGSKGNKDKDRFSMLLDPSLF